MRTARLKQLFVAIVVAMSGVSCSGNPSGTGRVHGIITLDGQSYPDAQVVFTPAEGRPSSGITDSNGRYELTYVRDVKGAAIGKHTISITTIQKSSSDRGDDPPFKETIPDRYNVRTVLSEDVKPGDNSFDFALTSQ
jgi:hypothetical protein